MIQVIITSIFLGVGLAMDACAVSMSNGLNEPEMKIKKVVLIALMFGLFQAVMPFIGYLVGSAFLKKIEWIIPWLALGLLGFIGGKMLIEGVSKKETEEKVNKLTFKVLLVQAVATSIDALSVGFTISDYTMLEAIVCVSVVAVVTFIISFFSVHLGKKFGTKLDNEAAILGGIILIAIGIEIFVSHMFF